MIRRSVSLIEGKVVNALIEDRQQTLIAGIWEQVITCLCDQFCVSSRMIGCSYKVMT